MKREKAKGNIKKYKRDQKIILGVALVVLVAILLLGSNELILLAAIAAMFFYRFVPLIHYRKYILNPLYDQLDVSLYQEIVKEGKLYIPSALYQLQGEYFAGNYENVIGMCHKKMQDPKIGEAFKY